MLCLKLKKMKLEKYFIYYFTFILYSIQSTPLDDYVFSPDPNYGYTLLTSYNLTEYSLFVYNFTSQKWYDGKYFCIFELIENQPKFEGLS